MAQKSLKLRQGISQSPQKGSMLAEMHPFTAVAHHASLSANEHVAHNGLLRGPENRRPTWRSRCHVKLEYQTPCEANI